MTDKKEETLLEFPCNFSVKVMGLNEPDFDGLIFELVNQHCDALGEGALTSKVSKNGKYMSVTVTITATSKQQLDNIYYQLSDHSRVLMAL